MFSYGQLKTFASGFLRRLEFNAAVFRRRLQPSLLARRMLTGWCSSLPKLVIIRVNKGGTSALFEYLSQHPQVIPRRQRKCSSSISIIIVALIGTRLIFGSQETVD
jgi:hypothetical protein